MPQLNSNLQEELGVLDVLVSDKGQSDSGGTGERKRRPTIPPTVRKTIPIRMNKIFFIISTFNCSRLL